ncbi:TPA: DUF1642 domain-containing protein [Streptococcus suis]|nr:DUF1642 domain-containing protein [Streptococcus suis]HEM3545256.1 DUF1642 domain-containing protein [Streptococcus suis]
MNKQEAIEKIKNIDTLNINDRIAGQKVDMVIKNQVIDLVSQIHEPLKVLVPAYIDSYIRYAKSEGMSLFIAMDNAQNKESEWIIANEETFTRAWLDGYVVEKEKLYTVEIPDPNRKGTNRIYLGKSDPNGKVFIHKGNFNTKKNKNLWLTEEEIKEDFEWAWQFRKEVE